MMRTPDFGQKVLVAKAVGEWSRKERKFLIEEFPEPRVGVFLKATSVMRETPLGEGLIFDVAFEDGGVREVRPEDVTIIQSDLDRLMKIMIDVDAQYELMEVLLDPPDDLDDWAFVNVLFSTYAGKP
jgi:hypothetical protein